MSQRSGVVSLGSKGLVISEENYAVFAERTMKDLKDLKDAPARRGSTSFGGLTTTKLRGIYGLVMNVYTKINTPDDFEEHKSDLQYLRVKMAYEAGREDAVKTFLAKTRLMDLAADVGDYDQFKLYCRYAESLVAYFKFYGGKDK